MGMGPIACDRKSFELCNVGQKAGPLRPRRAIHTGLQVVFLRTLRLRKFAEALSFPHQGILRVLYPPMDSFCMGEQEERCHKIIDDVGLLQSSGV